MPFRAKDNLGKKRVHKRCLLIIASSSVILLFLRKKIQASGKKNVPYVPVSFLPGRENNGCHWEPNQCSNIFLERAKNKGRP